MNLPHRFPFRLVDRTAEGRAVLRATAGAFWSRDAAPVPAVWLVEAVAQAAAALLAPGQDGSGERLALAAVEAAELLRTPEPGETVEITVVLEARLGGVVRVRGEVRAEGESLGAATVVLARS